MSVPGETSLFFHLKIRIEKTTQKHLCSILCLCLHSAAQKLLLPHMHFYMHFKWLPNEFFEYQRNIKQKRFNVGLSTHRRNDKKWKKSLLFYLGRKVGGQSTIDISRTKRISLLNVIERSYKKLSLGLILMKYK